MSESKIPEIISAKQKERLKKTFYWNAFPSKSSSFLLDMSEINPSDNQFTNRWIKQLLETSQFSMDFEASESVGQQLKKLYFEKRSDTRSSIGFGYPLYAAKDTASNEWIFAPLFVWQLDLMPLSVPRQEWRLSRRAAMSILPNELLAATLSPAMGSDLHASFHEAIVDGHLNSLRLLKLCNELSIRLNWEGNLKSMGLEKIPNQGDLFGQAPTNGQLLWSGVLGLFPRMVASHVVKPMASVHKNFRKHSFTNERLNPDQTAILEALNSQDQVLVKGNTHTGLNETLAALVANQLSNGGRVLVVSPHVEKLQSVEYHLRRVLPESLFSFILTTSTNIREDFFEKMFAIGEISKKHLPFEEDHYQQVLSQALRLHANLDTMYEGLHTPIFAGRTWIEVVGLFLKNNEIEGRQLLNSQLPSADYQFDEDNYENLKHHILKGQALYQKIGTLTHPLDRLRPEIFASQGFEAAKSFTVERLKELAAAVSGLYHEYVLQIEDYAHSLQILYENYTLELGKKTTALIDDITDLRQRFGGDFEKATWGNRLKLSFFGLFSERHRTIKELKDKQMAAYKELQQAYWNKRYFNYTFSDIKGSPNFDKILRNLEDFKASLQSWRADIPNVCYNETQRLYLQTIHPDLTYQEPIERLEMGFKNLLEQLNQSGLFVKKFESDDQTVVKKRIFLEGVMESLENVEFQMRDFDAYFHWKHFWLQLDTPLQNLIKTLIKTKPHDWVKAFDSWFLHQILSKFQELNPIQDEEILSKYNATLTELRNLLAQKATNYWTHRRGVAIREIKRNNKAFHAQFFAKNATIHQWNGSILQAFKEEPDFMTTTFPCLFATLDAVFEILPFIHQHYDLIVLHGADQLVYEEVEALLEVASKSVIVGEGDQFNSNGSPTLYQTLKTFVPVHSLGYEAHNKGLLSEFINYAFYHGQLKPSPEQNMTAKAVELALVASEGHYDDHTQINVTEAEDVLKLLISLPAQLGNHLGRVGVVCFTRPQRNLLLERIEQMRTHRIAGNEAILRLLKFGLNVCTVQELEGKDFDYLIVSPTVNASSTVEVFFSDLFKDYGERLVKNIATCPTQHLTFCTSLTVPFIEEHRFSFHNRGLMYLSNLMALAASIENDNHIAAILGSLRTVALPKENPAADLIQYTTKKLSDLLPNRRIFPASEDFCDIIIASALEGEVRPTALVFDSFFWRFPKGDYSWDDFHYQRLNEKGFDVKRVWSLEGWRTPDKTPTQLANDWLEKERQTAQNQMVLEEAEILDTDLLNEIPEEHQEEEPIFEE